MAIPVLVLGASGSGKSASLRNFKPNEIVILNVAGKRLPFRGKYNSVNLRGLQTTARYQQIQRAIDKNSDKYKVFVIDDSQYLLAFEMFEKANQKGYDKFSEMAVNFKNLLDFIESQIDDDVIVYLLHHTDSDDSGNLKIKTVGKMLDQQLTLEGLFTIVIGCENRDGEHLFITKSNGSNPYKTPIGMFDDEVMDNDLKLVDQTIRKYYEIGEKENG